MAIPYVFVLRGLPAGGKSTFSKLMAETNYPLAVVSADGLTPMHGLPDTTLAGILETYELLIQSGLSRAVVGEDVLLDATFWRRSYREVLYRGYKGVNAELVLVRFVTPVDVCRARTQERVAHSQDPKRARSHVRSFADLLAVGDDLLDDELSYYAHVISVDCSLTPASIVDCGRQLPPRLLAMLARAANITAIPSALFSCNYLPDE